MNKQFNFDYIMQDSIKRIEGSGSEHTCPKPIDLMIPFLSSYLSNGQIVVDLFLGSGTTLIASEKNKNICYGMELDEHYCDVIRDRYIKWCKDNGKETELKLNGKKWIAV